MSIEGQKFYPGENATPLQIAALADEYRLAAEALRETGRRGVPLSRAPYRFVAIHAIELYLNALLLADGRDAADLRKLHHDLSTRSRLAVERLHLRKRTLAHLSTLSERREYLTTRYAPEAPVETELNRLAATLAEVADKVGGFISRATPVTGNRSTPAAT